MFYVLLNEDGTVNRYPYTLTDLIIENPQTSFTANLTDEDAASFSVYPVTPAEPPAIDHTQSLERTAEQVGDTWVENWTVVTVSNEVLQERTNDKAREVRARRNELLSSSDWTQIDDSPVDKLAWSFYRQLLRDIPDQEGFPWQVVWPDTP